MEENVAKIEALKEEIKSLDVRLAQIYSRIDSLECYPGNEDEIKELDEESDALEASKSKLKEEIKKLESNNGR